MEPNERYVNFERGRYVLSSAHGAGTYVLSAGDVIELYQFGRFEPVRVEHGGYCGWYYVTAYGRRARFALGMRARVLSRQAQIASGLGR